MKFLLLLPVAVALPLQQPTQTRHTAAQPQAAFAYGEQLEYRVHYGWLNAATIRMQVEPVPKMTEGRPTWAISGDGVTHGGYDWFFKVRDHYETYLAQDSLYPLKYIRNVYEGGYKDYEVATFDHQRGKVYSSKGAFSTGGSRFQDVLSAIYYLRCYDFSKARTGQRIYLKFYLDKQVYETRITFAGRETISTDLGTFRAVKLKPQVLVDRVFPDEDAMTIWATDDANLIPLRIQTELAVGSLKADITRMNGYRHPLLSKLK